MSSETLILTKKQVSQCLNISEVIEIAEETLKAHGEKKVILPPKVSLSLGDKGGWPNHNAYINAMPAYVGNTAATGIKWAGGFWNNREKGLPSIVATITQNDPDTGIPLAIMDGSLITDLRTAAVSGVGAKYLARDEVKTVGIYGAGTQGKTHLMIFDTIYEIEEFKIFDVNNRIVERFDQEMSEKTNAKLTSVENIGDLAKGCDVLVTVTTAQEPFIRAKDLAKGSFMSAVGSYTEITKEAISRCDKIVVDNLEQVKHRGNLTELFKSGDLIEEDIYSEIGNIVAGIKPGRENHE